MGKYMKKAKITGDIAVMEVSQSSFGCGGVRTRAKTLALQRLQIDNNTPPPIHESSSYLQLRNRRLEKPQLIGETKRNNQQRQSPKRDSCRECPNLIPDVYSNPRASSVNSGSVGSDSIGCSKKEEGLFCNSTEENGDFGVEASFGENNFEIEARERSTRESTPCSFIRDSDTIGTPGSTTRRISSIAANRRTSNAQQRNIPATHELEEFFARAEQQQQRLFIEKYNFDIVNDLPLPGRYEWVRV